MAEIHEMYPQQPDASELFSKQFFDSVLSEYKCVYDDDLRAELDRLYRESKAALDTALSAEQHALLDELEALFEQNRHYAMPVGFLFGVRAGRPASDEDELGAVREFSRFVVSNFLMMPGMSRFTEFFDRRTRINEIDDLIRSGLDDITAEHLATVCMVLHEYEHSTLMYTFEMGRAFSPASGESPPKYAQNMNRL